MPNTCKSSGPALKLAWVLGSGERVSNAWVTCPGDWDNSSKGLLIPDDPQHSTEGIRLGFRGSFLVGSMRFFLWYSLVFWVECWGKAFSAPGWARVPLASWWGNGLPRRRWVAGLRGWSATLGLRHGPDSYGRQQWGILRNGGNPDAATPRG